MTIFPGRFDLNVYQAATVLASVKRVQNAQNVAITGAGGNMQFSLFQGRAISALVPVGSAASVVQASLQNLGMVGTSGVAVTGAGTVASPYVFTWGGALKNTDMDLVVPILPSGVSADVSYLPFDWTGYTASMKIAQKASDGTFGANYWVITDVLDAAKGQIIFGYVPPAQQGGTPGTPDLTNGNVAILVQAANTTNLLAAMTTGAGVNPVNSWYILDVIKGTFVQALLSGQMIPHPEPV